MTEFVTIGVYGFDASSFFSALQNANVDTFCDIRRRRAVRGTAYAFANRLRLEARLAELGIRNVHFVDLAPSKGLRGTPATTITPPHVETMVVFSKIAWLTMP